jgi:DNA-directed RNA polymerase specialized sigma subunit
MENDIDLIKKVKDNNDQNSLQTLIDRHSGIYLDMVNSVIPNNCTFLDKNDLIEDKNFSIYKAILAFNPDKKAKFSTYLGNETRWKCLNLFNRGIKYKYEDIENYKDVSFFSENHKVKDICKNEILDKIFYLAEKHSDKRILKIMKLRYSIGDGNKPMPWRKISKQISISIQGCINIHNKFIEEIKKEINYV